MHQRKVKEVAAAAQKIYKGDGDGRGQAARRGAAEDQVCGGRVNTLRA